MSNRLQSKPKEAQRACNYYHTHIYLYDDAQQNLLMVGETGEAGQAMLSQGHILARKLGVAMHVEGVIT